MKRSIIIKFISIIMILFIFNSCGHGDSQYDIIKRGWSRKELVDNLNTYKIVLYDPEIVILESEGIYYYSLLKFNLFADELYSIYGYAVYDSDGNLLYHEGIEPISFDIQDISKGMKKDEFKRIYGNAHFFWRGGFTRPAYLTDTGILLTVVHENGELLAIVSNNYITSQYMTIYEADTID